MPAKNRADEEEDHTVLRFDHRVVVGNHDPAPVRPIRLGGYPVDAGAHRSLVGQVELLDAPPDDPGRSGVPLDHDFPSLRGAAAQAVHRCDISLADMGQQGADGDLVRGDGDVDAVGLDHVHVGAAVRQGQDPPSAKSLGQMTWHRTGQNAPAGIMRRAARRTFSDSVDILLELGAP